MQRLKKQIITNKAPTPAGPYSQAIVDDRHVYVAGQRPQDPTTGAVSDDIQEQTRQCIKNIAAILTEAGSSLENIVSSKVYLADLGDFVAVNEVYSEMIPQPYPSRTTIGCQLRGIGIEIDVIAIK